MCKHPPMTGPMTSAATRSKRYRRRLRSNRAVLPIEIDLFGVVDALLERGLISEEDSEDRLQVAAAVSWLVERWAKETITRNASRDRRCA